jgi:hypothetical protein
VAPSLVNNNLKKQEVPFQQDVALHWIDTQAQTIDIGLEQGPFVVFVNFFPHLNILKTCWLWAPTTLKTHH